MTASVTSERYRLALPVKAAFMAWWHALSDEAARGQLKADRAILRRCENLTDVTLSAAFQRVYWTLHAASTLGDKAEISFSSGDVLVLH